MTATMTATLEPARPHKHARARIDLDTTDPVVARPLPARYLEARRRYYTCQQCRHRTTHVVIVRQRHNYPPRRLCQRCFNDTDTRRHHWPGDVDLHEEGRTDGR